MGLAWLPNAERIDNQSKYAMGGTYLDDVPWRFVTHTTEVIPSSLAGAKAMAARHEFPPHLWAWPQRGWLGQTVPLDRSAAALVQPVAAPERRTNKARAIQVEIIGNAIDTPSWPEDWWIWLGQDVLAPIVAAGYPINLANVADLLPYPPSYGATQVRMGWPRWLAFDGLCSHQNVPGNLHGDIGAGRLDLVAIAARTTPIPPQEDDDMPTIEQVEDAVRRVLNEGTSHGQQNWAGSTKRAVSLIESIKNDTAKLADPAKIAAALAPLLIDHLPEFDGDLEEILVRVLPSLRIELAPAEGGGV